MKDSIVCFTVFNWRHPLHWVVAALQLLSRKRYWFIVHCAPLIHTAHGMSTVEVRMSRTYLEQYRPDVYRELYFFPMQCDGDRLALLLCASHVLNCADLTMRMARVTTPHYPCPAVCYEFALRYTSHRARRNVASTVAAIAVPTANNEGYNS
jgi:hypothetical protein